jgi:GNAT superfamily N-acetyltransferase
MNKQLKQLWHLAFGDGEEFIDLFFATAYSPNRCLYLTDEGNVTAALYWLDCEFKGKKQAYIYAVATHPDHRGKGLCRKLMDRAHETLKAQGYTAALLRPADEGLRRMYGKMGYRVATGVSEFAATAGTPVPLRKIGAREYEALRREYLPEDGVRQEGVSIDYLASYGDLYAGEDFLLAGNFYEGSFLGMELLGNRDAAPGILAALGHEKGSFRCPGMEIPFGMFLPLREDAQEPGYLGLVFD